MKDKLDIIKRYYYVIFGLIFVICIITFYSTFSINNEDPKYESLTYSIKDNYIENISQDTTVELFKKYFDLKNCYIEVTDINNNKLDNDKLINTRSKTIIYDKNDLEIARYTNIIKGDFNYDGLVNDKDLEKMGNCLVNNCTLEDYQLKTIDIDLDNELHINDLSLLDKTLINGYTDLSINIDNITLQTKETGRLDATTTPNYGLNQNLIWTSDDEAIATVDETGKVTGQKEGTTKIKATTKDGKITKEATVKVDNTIQLEKTEGIGYIDGDKVRVWIKSVDYTGLTCTVADSSIATCAIESEYLVITSLGSGTTSITVSSPKYGKATYKLTSQSVYLNVMPNYLCKTPNSATLITVSGFNSGELSFESSDKEIIKDAYMTNEYYNRNMLRIEFGPKEGRGILTVKESHAYTINKVTIDVTSISIPELGAFTTLGQDITTQIVGNNLGELSCKVEDETIATCKIEGTKLIVTPLKNQKDILTSTNIRVYNRFTFNGETYNCGEALFMVVIEEE